MPPLKRKKGIKLSKSDTSPPIPTIPKQTSPLHDDNSIEQALTFTGCKEVIDWWRLKKVENDIETLTRDLSLLKN